MKLKNIILSIHSVNAVFVIGAMGVADLLLRTAARPSGESISGRWICDNFITPSDAAAGLVVTILCATIISLALLKKIRPAFVPPLPGIFLFLWVVSLAASSVFNGNPAYSLSELRMPLILSVLYLIFMWSNIDHEGGVISVFTTIAGIGALFSIHGIFQYYGLDFLPGGARGANSPVQSLRVYSIFGNSNLLALWLSIALPAATCAPFVFKLSKSKKYQFLVSAALMLVAMFLTGSRGAIIAASAGFIAALLFSKSNTKVFVRAIAATLIAVAAIIAALSFSAATSQKSESAALRTIYIKSAWSMFLEKPVLGGGPGHFKMHYMDFQKQYLKKVDDVELNKLVSVEKPNHPHNEYMNYLADSGIVGTLFLVLAIIFGFTAGAKALRAGKHEAILWVSILASLSTAALFGFPFRVFATGSFLPLSLAAMSKMSRGRQDTTSFIPLPRSLSESAIAVPAMIAITLLATFFVSERQMRLLEARMYFTNARIALLEQKPGSASAFADSALAIYHDNGEFNFIAGAALHQSGKPDQALPFYVNAMKTSSDPALLFNIGLAKHETGDIDGAIDALSLAIGYVPSYTRAGKTLAQYYYEIGRLDLAINQLEAVLVYAPDDNEAIAALNMLKYMKDN
ncbi:MAG TPA: O-antigen ligase family protein [bacterium]|nr:O-antigen ligase family protein [bacterium]